MFRTRAARCVGAKLPVSNLHGGAP